VKNIYYPDAQQILDFYHLTECGADYAKERRKYDEPLLKNFYS
jgi:hypothetical protein